jgi:putative transposase
LGALPIFPSKVNFCPPSGPSPNVTLNLWVVRYSPLIAKEAQRRKARTSSFWQMDETYIKVRGKWNYLCRPIDKLGKTLDFILSKRRDEAAATIFFTCTLANNGVSERVVIDKSEANLAGLKNMNSLLMLNGRFLLIDILQVKYLNNIIEQDSCLIRKITHLMKGFKAFYSASAILEGIEITHTIHKKNHLQSTFQQFVNIS